MSTAFLLYDPSTLSRMQKVGETFQPGKSAVMCEQQLLSLKGYSKQLLKLKRTQTTLEQELADDSAVGNGGEIGRAHV